MAIVARTVSINAAFLQEIKDDHHELRQLLHHTGIMLNRPRWMPADLSRLVELLSKLRDQVAMHFSLEEAYGYLDDAVDVAPRLSRRAEQLRSEHYDLYSQLCRLADRAEQVLYHETGETELAALAEAFCLFSERFGAHERHESDLIVEALDVDLGVGD